MRKFFLGILLALVMLVSASADAVAPRSFDLEANGNGCYNDGSVWMAGWGVPGQSGGGYGGESYSNFCLVWEPGCSSQQNTAAVQLQFNGGSEKIVIRHLDGQSNFDSFDVLVNGNKIGHYTDSVDSQETWVVSEFPVSGITDSQAVALVATDAAWSLCDPWGQLAVDYINVEIGNQIPEFTYVGSLLGLVLVAGMFVILRKR